MSFLIKQKNGSLLLKINLDLSRWEEYFDMTAQDYLEFALSEKEGEGLEPGDKLMIPCYDFKQQESMRSRLYYLRSQKEKVASGSTKELVIFRETLEEAGEKKFFIVLQRRGAANESDGAFIIKKDGKLSSLAGKEITREFYSPLSASLIPEFVVESETSGPPNYTRIVKAAVQDGLSLPDLLKELDINSTDPLFSTIQPLYMEELREKTDRLMVTETEQEQEQEQEQKEVDNAESEWTE